VVVLELLDESLEDLILGRLFGTGVGLFGLVFYKKTRFFEQFLVILQGF
jgi:hypothetical protein